MILYSALYALAEQLAYGYEAISLSVEKLNNYRKCLIGIIIYFVHQDYVSVFHLRDYVFDYYIYILCGYIVA